MYSNSPPPPHAAQSLAPAARRKARIRSPEIPAKPDQDKLATRPEGVVRRSVRRGIDDPCLSPRTRLDSRSSEADEGDSEALSSIMAVIGEEVTKEALHVTDTPSKEREGLSDWNTPQLGRNMTVTLSRTKEATSYMDSDMRSLQRRFVGLTIVEEDTRHSQFASEVQVEEMLIGRIHSTDSTRGYTSSATPPMEDVHVTAPQLVTREDIGHMLHSERRFFLSEDHRKRYSEYRFSRSLGITGYFGVMNFNDVREFEDRVLWDSEIHPWPKRLEVYLMNMKGGKRILAGCVVAFAGTSYGENREITHWGLYPPDTGLIIELADGERISYIRMCPGTFLVDGDIVHHGVSYFEARTTWGRQQSIGDFSDADVLDFYSPTPGGGFMGFYGATGRALDRLGIVWSV